MRRARLGLCIGDREYGDRFTSCLMNHYRDQLELHMFSQKEALQETGKPWMQLFCRMIWLGKQDRM